MYRIYFRDHKLLLSTDLLQYIYLFTKIIKDVKL